MLRALWTKLSLAVALGRMSLVVALGRRVNLLLGILLAGITLLFAVSYCVLENIGAASRRSITNSFIGHIQIFSDGWPPEESKALMRIDGLPETILPVKDFARVRQHLETLENVRAVIPLGEGNASVVVGNTFDRILEAIRNDERLRLELGAYEAPEEVEARRARLRYMLETWQGFWAQRGVQDPSARHAEGTRAIAEATSAAFWERFDQAPFTALEFLENEIAPLVSKSQSFSNFYIVGTDLDAFARAFDRLEIVDGEAVPPNQRGFMLSKHLYEESYKLDVARRLDKLHEAVQRGRSIAQEEELQSLVSGNVTGRLELLLELDREKATQLRGRLQSALKSSQTDLDALLVELLEVDDANVAQHHRIFYDAVAPLVQLYRIRIGDVIALKSEDPRGQIHTANVRLYGTFRMRGFTGDDHDFLTSYLSFSDLLTFNEASGYSTAPLAKEHQALARTAGIEAVDRADIEQLLGAGDEVPTLEATPLETPAGRFRDREEQRSFTTQELESGFVINAAVLLRDENRVEETMARIRELSARESLAVVPVHWREASGFVGAFTYLSQIVVYGALAILLLLAVLIINNAATTVVRQRTAELGTQRAIGATREVIVALTLGEMISVGAVFGGIGAALGVALSLYLREVGIPAGDGLLNFFFGGSRLHPEVDPTVFIYPLCLALGASALSAAWPAYRASRVQPITAMRDEE